MTSESFPEQPCVEVWYQTHSSWLAGWLQRNTGCPDTAADLLHDTFVRILRKSSFPQPDNPRAYLNTVAKGLMLNFWRRQALEQAYAEALAQQPETVAPSEEERHQVIETLVQLAQILDGFSEQDKQIFLLARLDGLKYQQIAGCLNISLNVVQKSMGRSMKACYRVLYD